MEVRKEWDGRTTLGKWSGDDLTKCIAMSKIVLLFTNLDIIVVLTSIHLQSQTLPTWHKISRA